MTEHSIHEGLEERPLLCNPILTIFIAKGAFRDYKTMKEPLALKPRHITPLEIDDNSDFKYEYFRDYPSDYSLETSHLVLTIHGTKYKHAKTSVILHPRTKEISSTQFNE